MIPIRDIAADVAAQCPDRVEPLPCRPDAVFSPQHAAREFELFAKRFRIRKPAVSFDDLLMFPNGGSGICLEPMLQQGRFSDAYDPTVRADDGDIVLVGCSPAFMDTMFASVKAETPEWRADWMRRYAPNGWVTNLAMKVLRHGEGRRWITWNQHAVPLEWAGTVLATCVHIEVDGKPAYGSRGFAYRYAASWLSNFVRPWRNF